jgi:hypothetical protein
VLGGTFLGVWGVISTQFATLGTVWLEQFLSKYAGFLGFYFFYGVHRFAFGRW